jgi:hypothetical protein
MGTDFGHIAAVVGYDSMGQRATGNAVARGAVDIAIWWRVQSTPQHGDLSPVVRLADPWGSEWGQASPFHYPGEQWRPGELIVDHLTIPVVAGAPPGEYEARVSLYSAQDRSAVPVLDSGGRYAGTWARLSIRLERPAIGASGGQGEPVPDDLGIGERLDVRSGDLVLLGSEVDVSSVRQGERVPLTLFWQAGTGGLPDRTVELLLGDTVLYAGAPVHGTYPFSQWRAGELVADRYDPRLPRETVPGTYPLQLRLGRGTAESPNDLDVELAVVTVRAVERTFAVPPMSHPHGVVLDGTVELLGYSIAPATAAPGDSILVTLYWRALTEMERDYTVFVHLAATDGSMAGQHDGHPVGGTYPTSLWLAGEVVIDSHEVRVGEAVPAGEYGLEAGMYVAETGARLPDLATGEDAVRLQPVSVAAP